MPRTPRSLSGEQSAQRDGATTQRAWNSVRYVKLSMIHRLLLSGDWPYLEECACSLKLKARLQADFHR
jgi:hypothetical protein